MDPFYNPSKHLNFTKHVAHVNALALLCLVSMLYTCLLRLILFVHLILAKLFVVCTKGVDKLWITDLTLFMIKVHLILPSYCSKSIYYKYKYIQFPNYKYIQLPNYKYNYKYNYSKFVFNCN